MFRALCMPKKIWDNRPNLSPLANLEFLHKLEIQAKAELSDARVLKMCFNRHIHTTPEQRFRDLLVQGNFLKFVQSLADQ